MQNSTCCQPRNLAHERGYLASTEHTKNNRLRRRRYYNKMRQTAAFGVIISEHTIRVRFRDVATIISTTATRTTMHRLILTYSYLSFEKWLELRYATSESRRNHCPASVFMEISTVLMEDDISSTQWCLSVQIVGETYRPLQKRITAQGMYRSRLCSCRVKLLTVLYILYCTQVQVTLYSTVQRRHQHNQHSRLSSETTTLTVSQNRGTQHTDDRITITHRREDEATNRSTETKRA